MTIEEVFKEQERLNEEVCGFVRGYFDFCFVVAVILFLLACVFLQ